MDGIYDKGDEVVLEATVTDPVTGAPVDPSSVVCTIVRPDGSTIQPAVTLTANVAEARYIVAGTDPEGWYWYAFDASGSATGAEEGRFYVRPRKVPR